MLVRVYVSNASARLLYIAHAYTQGWTTMFIFMLVVSTDAKCIILYWQEWNQTLSVALRECNLDRNIVFSDLKALDHDIRPNCY